MYKTAAQIAYSVLDKLANQYEYRAIRNFSTPGLLGLGFKQNPDDPTRFTSPIERSRFQRAAVPVAGGLLGAMSGEVLRRAMEGERLTPYAPGVKGKLMRLAPALAGAALGSGAMALAGGADKYPTIRQGSVGQLKDQLIAKLKAKREAAAAASVDEA